MCPDDFVSFHINVFSRWFYIFLAQLKTRVFYRLVTEQTYRLSWPVLILTFRLRFRRIRPLVSTEFFKYFNVIISQRQRNKSTPFSSAFLINANFKLYVGMKGIHDSLFIFVTSKIHILSKYVILLKKNAKILIQQGIEII